MLSLRLGTLPGWYADGPAYYGVVPADVYPWPTVFLEKFDVLMEVVADAELLNWLPR